MAGAAWQREWHKKHPGRKAVLAKRYRTKHKAKLAIAKRDSHLRCTYGITTKQYDIILALQGGVCAICKRPPKATRLHVDHDHHDGRVRGLLCYFCNRRVVGRLTLENARRVVEYLERDFDGRKVEEAKEE